MLEETAQTFSAAQTQNNHTETVLIESLMEEGYLSIVLFSLVNKETALAL